MEFDKVITLRGISPSYILSFYNDNYSKLDARTISLTTRLCRENLVCAKPRLELFDSIFIISGFFLPELTVSCGKFSMNIE